MNHTRRQDPWRWVLVPNSCDDGGISGASLDRPNLRRLLADIKAGNAILAGPGSEMPDDYNDFFNVDLSGLGMNREYDDTLVFGSADDGDRIVTTFSIGRPDVDGDEDIGSTVLEPSSLPMLLAGLGLIGGSVYFGRHKAKTTA